MRMTLEDIGNGIESLGLPVAYHAFKSAVSTPFVVYMANGTDNFDADNRRIRLLRM